VVAVVGVVAVLQPDDERRERLVAGPGNREYEGNGVVLEDATHGPELCLGAMLASDPPQCRGIPVVDWSWDVVSDEQVRAGTRWAGVHVRGRYDGETFTLTAPPGPVTSVDSPTLPDFSPACAEPEVVDPGQGETEWETEWGTAAQPLGRNPELVATWVSNTAPGQGPFVANVVVRPGAAAAMRDALRRYYGGPLCLVERDQRTAMELQEIQNELLRRFGEKLLSGNADNRRGVVQITLAVVTPELQEELDKEYGNGTVELTGRLKPVG